MQTASDGRVGIMYAGRAIAGLGIGQCSLITFLYISENSSRAIRGGLTGTYQLFIEIGAMLAFGSTMARC